MLGIATATDYLGWRGKARAKVKWGMGHEEKKQGGLEYYFLGHRLRSRRKAKPREKPQEKPQETTRVIS